MTTPEELADETFRSLKVRQIVDISTSLIKQSAMTRRDAEHLVCVVRERILTLLPNGRETYELVYAPRFRRLVDEFAHPDGVLRDVVIPFRVGRS